MVISARSENLCFSDACVRLSVYNVKMVYHVFSKMKNFSQKFSFLAKILNQKFSIWPLLCTSKKMTISQITAFGSFFWHFGENREKDVKPTLKSQRAHENAKIPRIFKIGTKTVFLVRFTLTHEQKFLPFLPPKFDQNWWLGRVL